MKCNALRFLSVSALLISTTARAQFFTLEPDNFTNNAVLDHALAPVSLITALSDNQPVSIFDITATYDSLGYTSTGTNVFGHVGIPFFNSDRRLRMDFAAPVTGISIDFIGGEFFSTEVGQLDAYNNLGQLIGSYTTGALAAGNVETMSVLNPAGNIAWAVAYIPPNLGSFGRLDNLRFTVVPEPTAAGLMTIGGIVLQARTCKRRQQKINSR